MRSLRRCGSFGVATGNGPRITMEEPKTKLKVYCETSFWSYLTAKPSDDPEKAMRQAYSLRWWSEAAPKCDIFVSDIVHHEAGEGDADAASKRLSEIEAVPFLDFDREAVLALSERLRQEHQVFATEVYDAAHIAIASVTGMNVLLTWNCKHMANIVELPKTVAIVSRCGYDCPLIVTPKDFLEGIHV